jgi:hypothetical protein
MQDSAGIWALFLSEKRVQAQSIAENAQNP